MTRDNTDPLVWLGKVSRNDANFVNDLLMIALETTSFDTDKGVVPFPWKFSFGQASERIGLSDKRITQIAEKLIAYYGGRLPLP